jgi:hypothetical protein
VKTGDQDTAADRDFQRTLLIRRHRAVSAAPGGLVFLGVSSDSSGGAQCPFDRNSLPPGSLTSGSNWNFQFVYRDLAGGGLHTNRSDALAVRFRP